MEITYFLKKRVPDELFHLVRRVIGINYGVVANTLKAYNLIEKKRVSL